MIGFFDAHVGLITAIVGLITIFAILFSPVIALKIQKKIEKFNEQNQRKLYIFKTLLATRADTVSLEHVQALNLIDIEFYNEKEIRGTWNIYRDHLNSYPQNQDKNAQERWEENRINYFTDLLYSMSKYFSYDFDKVILKKGAYSPMAHGILNMELALIRKRLVELLSDERALTIKITEPTSRGTKEI
ncbi:hypothetical protein TUM19329_07450 [Legionella antarctica]|uniref:DUF6680 domain-containing protein n=1 Tax=Legionella antarctica TaxID=2708020 RepID=A0A6F8T123_9GAMM|nr:DUF6680 family protein [Legionella antarctica]BCA94384.1 hypothetical protein TUM19329_07450 [Legionella antarctica]